MATHSSTLAWKIPWTEGPGAILNFKTFLSFINNGTPLQYSRLENPMDGGAWKAAVHGVAEGWT